MVGGFHTCPSWGTETKSQEEQELLPDAHRSSLEEAGEDHKPLTEDIISRLGRY